MDRRGKIIEISSVGSTNNFASELLKTQDLADETIIWAKSQLQGRGQRGNSWLSEAHKNITCSFVISPHFLPIEKQFFLSVLISVSVINCLKDMVNNLKIKWPNDIYYKDFKLGGILVENTIRGAILDYSIIGVGLNINQEIFPKELPNPISLKNISGLSYDVKTTLEELSTSFSKNYDKLKNGSFLELKNEYLDMLYLYGKNRIFKDANGSYIGRIIDVLDTGELIIVDELNKKRSYWFKEVEFVRE